MRGMLLCAVRFVGRALASEGNVCILHVLVRFEFCCTLSVLPCERIILTSGKKTHRLSTSSK